MKKRWTTIGAVLALSLAFAGISEAGDKKKYKNLKVLADNGKTLSKGMKNMTKGLGVKCTACHIKGDWDKDEVETKADGRKFFEATVGVDDEAKKKEALATLLKVLKKDSPRDEKRLWKGVSMLKKK